MTTKKTFVEFLNICEAVDLDEVRVTRSPEVKKRAKNIKNIKDKKEALAAMIHHAKLQKKGLVDQVEYNGDNVDEILVLTPLSKKPPKKSAKSNTQIQKPDPNDPNYVEKYRSWIKSRKQEEMIDYGRLSRGAEAANEKRAAHKEKQREIQQNNANAARRSFRTKGIPFSDVKGSGHIVNGKKVYDS